MVDRWNDWERRRRGYERENPYRGYARGYDYNWDRSSWINEADEPGRWRDVDDWGRYRPRARWYEGGYGADWTSPGPYTGRGPRGYQRSDERIGEDVCERLTLHGQIDASDVDITVDNGEVTLTGMVDSRPEKRLAEDAAETVSGVRDVHNQLRVRERGLTWQTSGMAIDNRHIRRDMEVVGSDGERIGRVKEVRTTDFLVDRPMARDVYVPFGACRELYAGRVVLDIPAIEVDKQNWASPELIETGGAEPSKTIVI